MLRRDAFQNSFNHREIAAVRRRARVSDDHLVARRSRARRPLFLIHQVWQDDHARMERGHALTQLVGGYRHHLRPLDELPDVRQPGLRILGVRIVRRHVEEPIVQLVEDRFAGGEDPMEHRLILRAGKHSLNDDDVRMLHQRIVNDSAVLGQFGAPDNFAGPRHPAQRCDQSQHRASRGRMIQREDRDAQRALSFGRCWNLIGNAGRYRLPLRNKPGCDKERTLAAAILLLVTITFSAEHLLAALPVLELAILAVHDFFQTVLCIHRLVVDHRRTTIRQMEANVFVLHVGIDPTLGKNADAIVKILLAIETVVFAPATEGEFRALRNHHTRAAERPARLRSNDLTGRLDGRIATRLEAVGHRTELRNRFNHVRHSRQPAGLFDDDVVVELEIEFRVRLLRPGDVGRLGDADVLGEQHEVLDHAELLERGEVFARTVRAGVVHHGERVGKVRVFQQRWNRALGELQPVEGDHADVHEPTGLHRLAIEEATRKILRGRRELSTVLDAHLRGLVAGSAAVAIADASRVMEIESKEFLHMQHRMLRRDAAPEVVVARCEERFVEPAEVVVQRAAPHRLRPHVTTIEHDVRSELGLDAVAGSRVAQEIFVLGVGDEEVRIDERHPGLPFQFTGEDFERVGPQPVIGVRARDISAA